MGQVCWSNMDGKLRESRRILSGEHPEQGMWMKYVDPENNEDEHFDIYEQTLVQMKNKGL